MGAEPSPYTYQYAVADDYSGAAFSQGESNDGTGAVSGSYSVNLPDGRIQTVTYNANDLTGNIATVEYSGTAAYPEAHAVVHPLCTQLPTVPLSTPSPTTLLFLPTVDLSDTTVLSDTTGLPTAVLLSA